MMEKEKRLIDANELTDRLNHTTMVAYPNLFPGLLAAVEIVDDSPTVDAVEVVRCRDCKRCFKHTTKRNRQYMWICMRNDTDLYVRPDDFCSYGERKDGDGNG